MSLRIEFDHTTLQYYVYDLYYTDGHVIGYRTKNGYQPYRAGTALEPLYIFTLDEYRDLKEHFLTEHEQPLEAKQAVIDELRDVLFTEQMRVDRVLDKALGVNDG